MEIMIASNYLCFRGNTAELREFCFTLGQLGASGMTVQEYLQKQLA